MGEKVISLKFVWGVYLKLMAEGDKLMADGNKLWAKGSKLWEDGILEEYGNVPIEWISATHCVVDGTDEYTEEMR